MIKWYGVYDIKENEQCVMIGTADEVVKFLHLKSKDSMYSMVSRGNLVKFRYLIKVVEVEE